MAFDVADESDAVDDADEDMAEDMKHFCRYDSK